MGIEMKKLAHHRKGLSRRHRNPGGVIFFSVLVIVFVCAYALSRQRASHANPPISSATQASPDNTLGQFPPYTEAEREIEKMLGGKDEDIDLALANWLIVADIPQFAGVTKEQYFARLNEMVDEVRMD